jgi:predicted ATPase/DNA-binding CsgD family transcriptional regulator
MRALADAEREPRILPLPRTSIVGRERERAQARKLLLDEGVPLLTLTGPAGVGKTRLALAVAADVAPEFADDVVFVDFAPVTDPRFVAPTIAATLGVPALHDDAVIEALVAHLRPRQTLLILDNCEHLLLATAELSAELLLACPALQILATSRAPLRVRGEHVMPVFPLESRAGDAAAVAEVMQIPAVTLFWQRAHAADSTFTVTPDNAKTIAALCRELDGLPLAIELVAARSALLTPAEMLARIDRRLDLLGGGSRDAPARQRTLRSALAWSHDLLEPEARVLFARLGAFSGGWTIEAAEAVAGAERGVLDALAALVDQSLVQRVARPGREPRFSMLETIREFALERLAASGEETAIRDAHAVHFLDMVEAASPHPSRPPSPIWIERLHADHANLRAASAWLRQRGRAEHALRLASRLVHVWRAKGRLAEGRTTLEGLIAEEADVSPAVLAAAMSGIGTLAWAQGDVVPAAAWHERALALFERSGDDLGAAFTLNNLGIQIRLQGDPERAERLVRESLGRYETCGDAWGVWLAHANLGAHHLDLGDLDAAERQLSNCLPFLQQLEDRYLQACTVVNLGEALVRQGRDARAEERLGEALALWRSMDDRMGIAYTLAMLGTVAQRQHRPAEASASYAEALAINRDLNDRIGIAQGLERLAGIAAATGRPERAARLFGAADALRYEIGAPLQPAEQIDRDTAMATVQLALGAEATTEAWHDGRALTISRAVAEASDIPAEMCGDETANPVAVTTRGVAAADLSMLTRREREVLALLARRLTDTEIGERLYISPRTASTHVASILAKLGAANRRDAAAAAVRLGLI